MTTRMVLAIVFFILLFFVIGAIGYALGLYLGVVGIPLAALVGYAGGHFGIKFAERYVLD